MITEAIYREGILCVEARGHVTAAVAEAVELARRYSLTWNAPYRLTMIDHFPPPWDGLASDGITRFVFQTKEAWEADQKAGEQLMETVRKSIRETLGVLGDGKANDN